MARKDLVIDITTNAKNFLDGFEDAIKQIEKAANNADLVGSLTDDVQDLKASMTEMKQLAEDVKFGKVDSSTFETAMNRMVERFKKLRQEFQNVKLGAGLEGQLETFKNEILEIKTATKEAKNELQNLFTITNSTVGGSKEVLFNREDIETAKKELQKLKKEKENLTEPITFNMDLGNAKKELGKQLDVVQNYAGKMTELNKELAKHERGSVGFKEARQQMTQLTLEALHASKAVLGLAQMLDEAGVTDFGATINKQLNSSSLSKTIDQIRKNAAKVYDAQIRTQESIVAHEAELPITKFEMEGGKILIPIEISTPVSSLAKTVNAMIASLQGYIKNPIQVPIQLIAVSKTKKGVQDQLTSLSGINQLQSVVDSIENDSDKLIAQRTLDKLKGQFQNQFKIEVTSNIKEVQGEISNVMESIQHYIDESNIVIKPEINFDDEQKEAIKQYINELITAIKNISDRMEYLTPGFAGKDFIGPMPEATSGVDALIQKLDELKDKLGKLPDKVDIKFDEKGFDDLQNHLQTVGTELSRVIDALSKTDIVGSDGALQGFVGDLKGLTGLLDTAKKNNLYSSLKILDSMNAASNKSRTNIIDTKNISPDLKQAVRDIRPDLSTKLKKMLNDLIKEAEGELELGGYLNTKTGSLSPSAYFHHGESSPRGTLVDYLKSIGHIKNQNDLSQMYDLYFHTHPIHNVGKLKGVGSDLTWSEADFNQMRYPIEGIPKKMGVMSNGKARILDWNNVETAVAEKIAARYQAELDSVLNNTKQKYAGNGVLDYDARSKISGELISKIIKQETGLSDISNILYEGTLEDLFKPDISGLDAESQALLNIMESIVGIKEQSQSMQQMSLFDQTQLDKLLESINKIKTVMEEMTLAQSDFVDLWKGFNQAFTAQELDDQWKNATNSISKVLNSIRDESIDLAEGDEIQADKIREELWQDLINNMRGKDSLNDWSKEKAYLTEGFKEYSLYKNMGGEKSLSKNLPVFYPKKDLDILYNQKYNKIGREDLITPQVERYKTILQDAFKDLKIQISPQIELSNETASSLSKIFDTNVFSELYSSLNEFYTLWKQVNNVFSRSEIDTQFSKVTESFNAMSDKTRKDGALNLTKVKKDLPQLIEEYKKYYQMGGDLDITSLTDNKKIQGQLSKQWEAELKKIQSLKEEVQKDNVTIIDEEQLQSILGTFNKLATELETFSSKLKESSTKLEAGQIENLETKIREVITAINDKNAAFMLEQGIVSDVITTELANFESLRQKIEAVVEEVRKLGIDFDSLSKINFKGLAKNLEDLKKWQAENPTEGGQQKQTDQQKGPGRKGKKGISIQERIAGAKAIQNKLLEDVATGYIDIGNSKHEQAMYDAYGQLAEYVIKTQKEIDGEIKTIQTRYQYDFDTKTAYRNQSIGVNLFGDRSIKSYDKTLKLMEKRQKLLEANEKLADPKQIDLNNIEIKRLDDLINKEEQLRQQYKLTDQYREDIVKNTKDYYDERLKVLRAEQTQTDQEKQNAKASKENYDQEEKLIKEREKLERDLVVTPKNPKQAADQGDARNRIDEINKEIQALHDERKARQELRDAGREDDIKTLNKSEKKRTRDYRKNYKNAEKAQEKTNQRLTKEQRSQRAYNDEERLIRERANLERKNITATQEQQANNNGRIKQIDQEIAKIRQLRKEHKLLADAERKQGISDLEKAEKARTKQYQQDIDDIRQKAEAEGIAQSALVENYQAELQVLKEIAKLRKQSLTSKDQGIIKENDDRIQLLQGRRDTIRNARNDTDAVWDKRIQQYLQKSQDSYLNSLTSEVGKFSTKANGFATDVTKNLIVPQSIDEYNQKLQELNQYINLIKSNSKPIDLMTDVEQSQMQEYINQARELVTVLDSDSFRRADQKSVAKTDKDINSLLQRSSAMPTETRQKLQDLKAQLVDIDKVSLENVRGQLASFEAELEGVGQTFSSKLYKKFRDLGAYFASYISIQDFIRYAREGFEIIHNLDDALTEMAKVSDEPLSRLQEYQTETYNIANAVGTTGLTIQQSTADWMRLGESLEQAKESAKAASVLFNVSEFEGIDQATESLVSMSQAYSNMSKMDIIDKLNNIGNNYSIATDELATALQSSAATLKTAGNDIDESIALVTAGNAIVQDASKVGTAFRTVALRITGTKEAKEELAELGEDTDDFVVQTQAKSQQIIKDYTAVASNGFAGVDILDENGNFKSTYQILQEIADVYEEIVETDKQYGTNRSQGLLETLAGKNRANVVASVLQNPDLLRSVYESSQNSEGSAEKELEKYKDSISGHLAELQNKWQQAWTTVGNRDQINAVIDFGSAILDVVNNIGLLQTAIPTIALLYGTILKAGKDNVSILELFKTGIGSLGKEVGATYKTTEKTVQHLNAVTGNWEDTIETTTQKIGGLGISYGSLLGILALIAVGITGAVMAYKEYAMTTEAIIARNQELLEADKQKTQIIKDEINSNNENASSLSDLLSQYEQTTVGSQEYYNIRKQIADQFPELISGYDAEGQAIIASTDQIQAQIDKYKELSRQKQIALQNQARTNIDSLIGPSGYNTISSPGGDWYEVEYSSRRSYKTLLKQQQEIAKQRKDALNKIDKSKDGEVSRWYDRDNRQWIETVYNSAEMENAINKSYAESYKELHDQIIANQDALKDYYSIIANVSDEASDAEKDALNNLSELSSYYGAGSMEFLSNWNSIQRAVRKDETQGDVLSNLLNPDYSSIKASDYKDYMQDALKEVQKVLNISGEDLLNLKIGLNFDEEVDSTEQELNNLKDRWAERFASVGLDIETTLQDVSIADLLNFDGEQIISDHFVKTVQDKWSNVTDTIKDRTVSELSAIDWDKNITDPALQSIRGLANMAIDWGLAEDIQEAITLFGQLGLIIDDITDPFTTIQTEISDSITSFTAGASSFNSAMSEMQKNGAVTKDTYNALTGANEAYQDALVATSSGMQLNIDKLQEVKDAEEQVIRTKISDEIANQSEQFNSQVVTLNNLRQQLNNTNDAEEQLNLQNQIAGMINAAQATESNIASLQNLQTELDAATSKYQKWQNAQSGGDSGDQYDSIFGYKDAFKTAYDQGRYGDEGFLKFIELFTGETDRNKISNNAEGYYDDVSKFIKNYFTEDDSGVIAFYDTMEQALQGAGLNWSDGQGGIDIKNYDVLRHVLTDYFQQNGYGENFEVTSELLEIIGKAFREYGLGDGLEDGTYVMDVNAQQESLDLLTSDYNKLVEEQKKYFKGSDKWNELQQKIEETQEGIDGTTEALNRAKASQQDFATQEELSSDLSTINNSQRVQEITGGINVDVPLTFSGAEQAESSIEGLVELKKQLLEEGKMNIESSEIKAIDDLIQHAIASKMALIRPAYLDIKVSDVASQLGKSEEEVANFKGKVDELRQALENQHLAIQIGDSEGFDKATQDVQTLREDLQNMDPSGELSKAFEIDSSSIDSLHDSLMNGKTAAGQVKSQLDITAARVSSMPTVQEVVAPGAITGVNNLNGALQTTINRIGTINRSVISPRTSTGKQGGGTPGGSTGKPVQYKGTASFARGTWSLSGKAAARGDIGAKKTEPALVGELGPEIRVRGSKWQLLGANGAEFTDVRKGDIIFNHKQSEALLKGQHINSRGKLIADKVYEDKVYGDDAFVLGTEGSAFNITKKRPPKNKNTSPSTNNDSSSNNDGDTKKKKNNNNKKDDTDKKLEDFKKLFESIFDWIEVKISRTTDKIESYSSKAEAALDKAADAASTGILNFYEDTAKKTKDLYDIAAANYHNAISEIYKQIGNEDRGSQYYYSFANKAMKTARSKGLITKGEEKKYKALVQNGEIKSQKDIDQLIKNKKDLSGHKLSEKGVARLSEAINLYKEWYEKGHEAEKAMEELNEQLREQVKSLKEVRDAERDARIERSKTLTQIKTGGFQATNDTDASYSNMLVNASNADLDIADKAYGNETKMLVSQRDKYGKQAKKAFKDAKSYINKTAKGKNKKNLKKAVDKLSKKYLKDIKKYVDKGQLIPEDTISKIQKTSPEAAARLIAYNQTVANLQTARLEEVAAYAENAASRTNNTNSLYENIEQAYNNDISLKESQKENRTTASGKNSLLNDEIGIQKNITANAQNRLKYWADQRKDLGNTISKTNLKNMGLSGKDETEVKKALQAAHDGQAIPNMDKLADLYFKGKISDNFMEQCIRYNEWLEAEKSAQYAHDMAKETEKKENSARMYEGVKNFRDEADYNKNSRLGYDAEVKNGGQYTRKAYDDSNAQQTAKAQARISMSEAQGHYANESDYTKQLQMNNRDLQHEFTARESMINTFNKYVEDNPWWVGTPEYYQALDAINDTTNNIDKLKQSSVELANEIKKLKWQKIDDGVDAMKRFNSEVDYYLSLIANEQMFDEDNKGNITKYGVASLDLNVAGYEAARATAEKQADIINEMNRQFKSGELDVTNKENIEKVQAWQEALHDTTLEALKYRQAILDEVRQAYEAQLSYLNKTIDKYKELKNAEKDAYDYQKQISESTKNITNLEKQLAAFEGNTSEEAVARVQKLRADLKEAKQNQSDQQYDKYLSDSQNMLDDLSNNFQEWIGSYMKDSDQVIADAKDVLAYKIDDLGKVDDTAKNTLATLKEFETNLGGTIETSNTPLGTAFETAFTSVLKYNGTTAAKSLDKIYNVVTKEYEALKPLQEAATNVEAQIQGFEDKELTLRDEEAVKKAKKDYDALSPEARKYVAQKYVDQLNTAYSTITQLRKKEDDRLAKQKVEKEAKQKLDEEAKRQADAVTAAALAKQTVGFASTDSKNTTQVDKAKEQALLDQIEDIRNQMRVNRDKYRVVKTVSQKADLDKQYNDLQVKLNKLYTKLAKLTKASTTSKNSTVYQALNPLASAFAPVTAKGTAKTYASGSSYIKKDQLAYTQDKGQEVIYRKSDGAMLTPLGKGDKVFTNAMSENLWKLAQMNIPDMINSAMSQPIVQNMNQNVNQSMGDVQFVINLYGVENYDKFKSQLVADTQFQNALQEMTLGAAMGRNSLSKFKYN